MYVHKRSIEDRAEGAHDPNRLWLLYTWTHLNKWHGKSKLCFDLVTNVENRTAQIVPTTLPGFSTLLTTVQEWRSEPSRPCCNAFLFLCFNIANKCNKIPDSSSSKHFFGGKMGGGTVKTAVLKQPDADCAADPIGISMWDLLQLHLLHSEQPAENFIDWWVIHATKTGSL